MRKPGFSFLVLIGLFSGAIGCQSIQKTILDDDCATTRLTFWDAAPEDSLPSPRQASEEALLAMKENDAQLLAARGSSLEDMEKGMHLPLDQKNWALGQTQVFVPELLQREYFAPRNTREAKNVERRKPLFARSQFGVEAGSLDAPSFQATVGLQARSLVPVGSPVGSAMNTYEVVPGDTLGTISKKIYGTPGRWMELAHLNHLGNGSLIYPKEILFYIRDSQVISQHQ
ncbi:MAG TPA: LysM domain-containing protein [Oligoflexus sp.]|uniref:LysM peptidoglycan-binding domain-containing protein n=1 Tax=Oligoflexus sp. TaxID=1971216 RepID=UPI002D7E3D52|nr:LysM domain-containing protein [Oligoflexus sp.]HET9237691.1 LysM domain-containing protein [Oligoflexus sp.]